MSTHRALQLVARRAVAPRVLPRPLAQLARTPLPITHGATIATTRAYSDDVKKDGEKKKTTTTKKDKHKSDKASSDADKPTADPEAKPKEGAEASANASSAPPDPAAKLKTGQLARIAELEAEIAKLTKDIQYQRADYQTLNRRSADDRRKAQDAAIAAFAKDVLGSADVLSSALAGRPLDNVDNDDGPTAPAADRAAAAASAGAHAHAGEAFTAFHSGVQLTARALAQTLEHYGVSPLEVAVGEPFDARVAEVAYEVPVGEVAEQVKGEGGGEWAAGDVVEVVRLGWGIKGKVVRLAGVGVVQKE